MNFYQVNQRETFHREFSGGYLCCPEGNRGAWPLMRALRARDVIFHYNAQRQAVLGISRVVKIGAHEGSGAAVAAVILGTECIRYTGHHLSEMDFDPARRAQLWERYKTYYEVHTAAVVRRELGKLIARVPQVYLLSVDGTVARSFLAEHGVLL